MTQHCYKCLHELEIAPEGPYCMKCREYAPKIPESHRNALRIDPTKRFAVRIDLTKYVTKIDGGYACAKCDKLLVRIEPGGILGEQLNAMDTSVILDHHIAKH